MNRLMKYNTVKNSHTFIFYQVESAKHLPQPSPHTMHNDQAELDISYITLTLILQKKNPRIFLYPSKFDFY